MRTVYPWRDQTHTELMRLGLPIRYDSWLTNGWMQEGEWVIEYKVPYLVLRFPDLHSQSTNDTDYYFVESLHMKDGILNAELQPPPHWQTGSPGLDRYCPSYPNLEDVIIEPIWGLL